MIEPLDVVRGVAALFGRPAPRVGQTPADVVHEENKWRVLRYVPRAEGLAFRTPVLLIPSLINRHYVLDLMPGKSFAESLVAAGHDVYVIDWGTPEAEDRFVSFEDSRSRRSRARCGSRRAKRRPSRRTCSATASGARSR